MSGLQNDMNRVVAGFVAQITELARRAAIDMVESSARPGAWQQWRRCIVRTAARRAWQGCEAHRRTSSTSSPRRFHAYVMKHPGLRIEQINKQLGTTTKDLALPIRKLIADGALKAKGEKRSTTYFAGEGTQEEELATVRATRSRIGCCARRASDLRRSPIRRRSTAAGSRRRGGRTSTRSAPRRAR